MSHLVTHVVGARPNFPKAAPVLRALRQRPVRQRLVHTGQHYDDRLSAVFFSDLAMPVPDVNLGVGSGSHAQQTAGVMTALETEFESDRPDVVVVYGDVNSTVAAGLVAAKMQIPVAHVEAGLRSFDMSMPEEVNRIVTDRLSTLLLATSADALAHLAREGVPHENVHFVGNPMIDSLLANLESMEPGEVREELGLPETYVVATLHRPGNVDSHETMAALAKALHEVAEQVDVVLPVHPRGAPAFAESGLFGHPSIHEVQPLPYNQFLALVRGAAAVVTDSGGIQEETTVLGIPCLTVRPNTERPVTVTHGTNRLVTPEDVAELVGAALATQRPCSRPTPPPLWDGRSGERIARVVMHFLDGCTGPLLLG
jgi:UDP-N-acetylglucosamine 2-epimerase (non-hydrolysing)